RSARSLGEAHGLLDRRGRADWQDEGGQERPGSVLRVPAGPRSSSPRPDNPASEICEDAGGSGSHFRNLGMGEDVMLLGRRTVLEMGMAACVGRIANAQPRPVSLFDGKTLDGWIQVDKNDATAWVVQDGAMASTGSGRGIIYTAK